MTLPFRRRHNDAEASHDRARALSSRRLLESLDADEEGWLTHHLEACTDCRREDEAYAADHELLRSLRDMPIEPPRDLWAKTSAALDVAAGKRGQPAAGVIGRRRWPGYPVRAAAGLFALLVVIGAALLPGMLPKVGPGSSQVALVPTVVPGPTAINVDTAAIPAARVGRDGKWDLFFTKVHEVCPRSSPECVPPPTQDEGSSLELLGAKASTVTISPANDQLVFEAESGGAREGKIYIVPVGPTEGPTQAPFTPTPSATGGTTTPSAPTESVEPTESAGPTPGATPFGQVEIAAGVSVAGEVAYSPDGRWLAFSAAPNDGSTGPDLYLYAVGGSGAATAVTTDHQTYFSAWLGNTVIASHITVPAGEPQAPGNPHASNGPFATEKGSNGHGQAIEGRAGSFLFDPATSARTELAQPDVWMPVVDADSRLVAYWSGTLRSTDGVTWQLGDGQVVLDAWTAGQTGTPGPSAEAATPAAPGPSDPNASPAPPIGPAGHETPLISSHVEDFSARFDPDGVRLAIWVSERAGETDGRLHLVVIDPATGAPRAEEPLPGVPALRRFSIDENRLAWVSPSGQDGHETALQVLGWAGDTFGQIHTEPSANLQILR